MPGHFIIGRPLKSLPLGSFSDIQISSLIRWNLQAHAHACRMNFGEGGQGVSDYLAAEVHVEIRYCVSKRPGAIHTHLASGNCCTLSSWTRWPDQSCYSSNQQRCLHATNYQVGPGRANKATSKGTSEGASSHSFSLPGGECSGHSLIQETVPCS